MMEKKILSFANLRLEGLYEAAKLQENWCEACRVWGQEQKALMGFVSHE
jgi:hypothetical protein